MKILQINCVYGEKSTGKLVKVLHEDIIKDGHTSQVVYGRGKTSHEEGIVRLSSEWYGKLNGLRARLTGLPYGGCVFSTRKLINYICREKPDVVHLHCINGYFVNIYRLVEWLKQSRIPTVLTLHAEFMHTANCSYAYDCQGFLTGCGHCPFRRKATKSLLFDRTATSWEKMYRAFSAFNDRLTVVSVSGWLRDRAKTAPILQPFSHEVILNGIDARTFRLIGRKEENKKTVLHVTADFDDTPGNRKGAEYVLKLARRLEDSGVHFLVVSSHQNLHGDIPSNIELLGRVSDQKKLARLYAQADVTLLTSRRETFSMPCAESLCCGTPVVGFRAGAPEQIALPNYSEFVEFGDMDALQSALEHALEKKWDRNEIARDAAVAYGNKTMTGAYLALYKRIISGS